MSDAPKVSIIVLNYHGERCLVPCLRSLVALDYPNKEIIVVDNASRDAGWDEARQLFPQLTFIENEVNLGFAKGMNRAMRLALERGAEWVWLFNNDATTQPNTLSLLMTVVARFPRAGLLSPLILDPDSRSVWFAAGRVNYFRMRTEHIDPPKHCQGGAYPSDILTGCALLIKKELLETVGYFDERFFLYYEDADLSVRARRRGFAALVVPGAEVFHTEQSKRNLDKSYFLVLSGLIFFAKHTPGRYRPYLWAYGTMRKLKNSLDIWRGRAGATEVRRAYRTYRNGRTD